VIKAEMIDADESDFLDSIVKNQSSRFGGIVNTCGRRAASRAISSKRSSDGRRDISLADAPHQSLLRVCGYNAQRNQDKGCDNS
jgi:hypothetical protein